MTLAGWSANPRITKPKNMFGQKLWGERRFWSGNLWTEHWRQSFLGRRCRRCRRCRRRRRGCRRRWWSFSTRKFENFLILCWTCITMFHLSTDTLNSETVKSFLFKTSNYVTIQLLAKNLQIIPMYGLHSKRFLKTAKARDEPVIFLFCFLFFHKQRLWLWPHGYFAPALVQMVV